MKKVKITSREGNNFKRMRTKTEERKIKKRNV